MRALLIWEEHISFWYTSGTHTTRECVCLLTLVTQYGLGLILLEHQEEAWEWN